jgi:hypothetical protein
LAAGRSGRGCGIGEAADFDSAGLLVWVGGGDFDFLFVGGVHEPLGWGVCFEVRVTSLLR